MVPLQVRFGIPVNPSLEYREVTLAIRALKVTIQNHREACVGSTVTPRWTCQNMLTLKVPRSGRVWRTGLVRNVKERQYQNTRHKNRQPHKGISMA